MYDVFDITIQYGCDADTVALTSAAGQSEYIYVLRATQNFAYTSTHTAVCPFTMVCEYYDVSSQSWIAWPAIPNTVCT